ncbi:hypothetical protein ZTR_01005 [Talaromyces verruculosus]|nr:hypothetical protein ZTR_01005 [Talaromyces verruculosus]
MATILAPNTVSFTSTSTSSSSSQSQESTLNWNSTSSNSSSNSNISPLTSSPTTVSINLNISAPFNAIQRLFDYLREHPETASALNATYPKRGNVKTTAAHNAISDQKFTIDLSPSRAALIPAHLREDLSAQGLNEVLDFFETVSSSNQYIGPILYGLSTLSGTDMTSVHSTQNLNFRLCDYNPSTANPQSLDGCGAHSDYGTFSIIFQDGTAGLEIGDADEPGTWIPIPGDETVILTGWCALVLSGGRVRAARHRVRREPGVRRLSAVLFVAPDLEAKLMPLGSSGHVEGEGMQPFSEKIMNGEVSVGWFKEVMGKRWRYREGNEVLEEGDAEHASQDSEIEKLVWG